MPGWAPLADVDLDAFDAVMAVNARGVAATLKHAARVLVDGGAVVVVASVNAWRGDPNISAYVASKHAALGVVRAAALDLGRRGIRVNAVAPGPVATGALLERMGRRASAGGLAVDDALAQAAQATTLKKIATVEKFMKFVFAQENLQPWVSDASQILAVKSSVLGDVKSNKPLVVKGNKVTKEVVDFLLLPDSYIPSGTDYQPAGTEFLGKKGMKGSEFCKTLDKLYVK